jgi:phytoene dehydrogenase-like protein
MTGNGFDHDVIVIGSGFGGSVAALRATEKGYRVAVLEGNSGMGKYHGRWGFEAFTNARGLMYHSTTIDPGVRYPPFAQHTFERKIEDKLMP